MNLTKKKNLAARVLEVGKNRIIFNMKNLAEIKEAITRQDIKTLHQEGIITIKPVKGRKKVKKRKTKIGHGKIKNKIKKSKQTYVKITRKLRKYLKELKNRRAIDRELYWKLRIKIKSKEFKNKANLKDYLKGIGINVNNVFEIEIETGEKEKKEAVSEMGVIKKSTKEVKTRMKSDKKLKEKMKK